MFLILTFANYVHYILLSLYDLTISKKCQFSRFFPFHRLIMALCDGLSHCKLALAFAVLMDLLGGAALLMGVFAPLEIKGQDFGDLLVYTGMKLLAPTHLLGFYNRQVSHVLSLVDSLGQDVLITLLQ